MGFLGNSAGKEFACNAGDLGLIPVLRRSPGEGKGYPLQYAGLENSMDYPRSHKELDTTEELSLSLLKSSDFAFQMYRKFKLFSIGVNLVLCECVSVL